MNMRSLLAKFELESLYIYRQKMKRNVTFQFHFWYLLIQGTERMVFSLDSSSFIYAGFEVGKTVEFSAFAEALCLPPHLADPWEEKTKRPWIFMNFPWQPFQKLRHCEAKCINICKRNLRPVSVVLSTWPVQGMQPMSPSVRRDMPAMSPVSPEALWGHRLFQK